MTGPVTNPPPSGPGRVDVLDDVELQLATVGCEAAEGLDDEALRAIRAAVAAAPAFSSSQRINIARLFGGTQ